MYSVRALIHSSGHPRATPMTAENVRAFKRARPFRRFLIHTSSGDSFLVRHPELLAFTFDRKGVMLAAGRSKVALIDLDNVSALTCDPTKPRDTPGE